MAQAIDDRYQAYMDAIRRRVCAVCLDKRDDGSCHLAGGRLCAIEAQLPRVVEAVLAVRIEQTDGLELDLPLRRLARAPVLRITKIGEARLR